MARRWIRFRYQDSPGRKVYVAGSFNQWKQDDIEMIDALGDGVYTARVLLPTGRHEYKLIVDGAWISDPANPDTVPNDKGSVNSVLIVE